MGFKFNPLTGKLDLVGDDGAASTAEPNFSFKKIDSGDELEIKENQQMLVDGHITVLGHLLVSGELVDISNRMPEKFFYTKIETDDVVEIAQNRLLLYKNHITIEGHLRVLGELGSV